ncbi:MAG: hypothetical protein J6P40_07855 [Oscillospiraceae bacterium]|nr:hypothetical protein [Oscillospiraceae bacterium]
MNDSHQYDDIITLPHHVSERHPHMPLIDRAAQFSPFAALTGYEAAIVETARPTETKRELSEEQKQIISSRLYELQNCISSVPRLTVVFFQQDDRKSGGTYRTVSGPVKKVNDYLGVLEMADGLSIPFQDILSLDQ